MSIYTTEEIWDLASTPDIDLEFQHVLAMTNEEIRTSLRSRGHDLRVLEAHAMIMMGLPRKRVSSYRAGFIGAGAAATITAFAASAALFVASQPAVETAVTAVTATTAAAPGASPAESFRAEGLAACGDARWNWCLERLDLARGLDPEGDDTPLVREARERAKRALANGNR
jgi:hypothetical protein